MDKRTRSLNSAHFLSNLRQHFVDKVKEKLAQVNEDPIGNGGYRRSMDFVKRSDFFRHGSRTFLKNRRKQLKINARRA